LVSGTRTKLLPWRPTYLLSWLLVVPVERFGGVTLGVEKTHWVSMAPGSRTAAGWRGRSGLYRARTSMT
jgi:hypothetical protein